MKLKLTIFLAIVTLMLTSCPSPMIDQDEQEIITINTEKFLTGKINETYSDEIELLGDKSKFLFTSSNLPNGLTLSENGLITGIPLEGGTFYIQVKATEKSNSENVISKEIPLTINLYDLTLLHHLAVDNNMDYEFEKDFKYITSKILSLESMQNQWNNKNKNIQIVVLMDAYNDDTNFIEGYYALSGSTDYNIDIQKRIPEVNSGSVGDIKDFIDWTLDNYPADEYIYTISSHGSGFIDSESRQINYQQEIQSRGIGFDDTSDDLLSHSEIGEALEYFNEKIGKKLELFVCRACLMGGVELAYEIKDYSKYLLAAEEVFPAEYWMFDDIVDYIGVDKINGESYGKAICDSADNFFTNKKNRYFDLSLIDLSKVIKLYDTINDFSFNALKNMDTTESCNLYNYIADYTPRMKWQSYLDIGSFMQNICDNPDVSSEVKSSANDVLLELKDCIPYQTKNGYEKCKGLSIYYPYDFESLTNWYKILPIEAYKKNFMFSTNNWVLFIEKVYPIISQGILPDIYEKEDSNISDGFLGHGTDITIGEKQFHSIHDLYDSDSYQLKLSKGNAVKIRVQQIFYNEHSSFDMDFFRFIDNNTFPERIPFLAGNSWRDDYIELKYISFEGGEYYISIKTNDNSIGSYYIEIIPWVDVNIGDYALDIHEPDDDMNTATLIEVNGDQQYHTIHTYNDIDYFKLFLEKDEEILIEPIILSERDDLSYMVFYLDGFRRINRCSELTFSDRPRSMLFKAEISGYHYIQVEASLGKLDYVKYSIKINSRK